MFEGNVPDLLVRMSLALGIGLIIGLERGWTQREQPEGSRTAGIRTFAISGLLGGVIGALAAALSPSSAVAGAVVIAGGLFAYSFAIVVFSREENRAEGTFSATTAIAGIATFALGLLALVGDMRMAAATAVAIAALLLLRRRLHGLLEEITWPEMRSALVLLAMTFVALPFIPEGKIDALFGLDLRQIWLTAIVLAGVGFAGYAAVRYFGARRGLLVAAFAGGLVSSTALTLDNARRARAHEAPDAPLAAGVMVATAISYVRVLAIAAALNAALVPELAPALIAATLTALVLGGLLFWRAPPDGVGETEVRLKNPFGFWAVVGFAIFLGLISLGGRLAAEYLGPGALIGGALVLGLADVDAITVSMAQLARTGGVAQVATLAILAAVLTNTIAKIALVAVFGSRRFALITAAAAAFILVVAALAHWFAASAFR